MTAVRLRLPRPARDQRGVTLVELLVALVVLALAVLSVSQLFPAGTRSSLQSRMTTTASLYSQEKLEQLNAAAWFDAALTPGRHPTAGFDTLGSGGQWRRHYEVAVLPAPLDNLKQVVVIVDWTYLGSRTVRDTLYLRR